jgi:hypothetical protein
MSVSVSRGSPVGSDVHVMLGLRLRFQQIVVAYEIFDRTDVIGQRLGK